MLKSFKKGAMLYDLPGKYKQYQEKVKEHKKYQDNNATDLLKIKSEIKVTRSEKTFSNEIVNRRRNQFENLCPPF